MYTYTITTAGFELDLASASGPAPALPEPLVSHVFFHF
jgi:hypothetical protein